MKGDYAARDLSKTHFEVANIWAQGLTNETYENLNVIWNWEIFFRILDGQEKKMQIQVFHSTPWQKCGRMIETIVP